MKESLILLLLLATGATLGQQTGGGGVPGSGSGSGGGGAVGSVFGRTGAVTASSGDYSVGQITGAAPLASPAFTGSPTAPTQTAGDTSTKVATDAFVQSAIAVQLTPGSNSAAAANTSALQAVLSAGSIAALHCPSPGTEYFINEAILYSNSGIKFDSPGCYLEQANGQNTHVLVNHAWTASPTTVALTWTSGYSASVAWTAHGLSAGQWVYLQGTMGYLSGTYTYASGASACTNGTQNVSMTNGAGVAVVIGTITVTGGVPTGTVTITNPGYGFVNTNGTPTAPTTGSVATCTGAATFTGGGITSTDPAFSGPFRVYSVTDANDFVITLRSLPAAAPVGLINAVVADTNLTLQNVGVDYNVANNGSAGGVTGRGNAVIINGVAGMQIDRTAVINKANYGYEFQGVTGVTFTNYQSQVQAAGGVETKDIVKIAGGSFDSTFSGIRAMNSDDVISMQGELPTGFLQYQANPTGSGNILNVSIANVSGSTAGSCAVLYADGYDTIDQISISGLSCRATGTGTVFVTNLGSGIGRATLADVQCNNDQVSEVCIQLNAPYKFLTINGLTGPTAATTNATSLITTGSGSAGAGSLFVRNVSFFPSHANDVVVTATTPPLTIMVDGYYANAFTAGQGVLVSQSGTGTGTTVTVQNGYGNLAGLINDSATGTPTLQFFNNVNLGSAGQLGQLGTSATVVAGGNHTGSSVKGWAFIGTGTTYSVYSAGGNTIGGTNLSTFSGTPTVTVYNGCGDIKADITSTILSKLSCVLNTNSAGGPTVPMQGNGSYFVPIASGSYTGTTGSIGGSALSAACSTGTATVTGATTSMAAMANATTAGAPDTTGAFRVTAQVTAANTVTVSVCGTGTPTASTYSVRVN